MAEYYPGPNPDYGTSGPEKGKSESGKGGSRFEMPKKVIETSAAYQPVKGAEGMKPLGELFKPEPEAKPAMFESAKEIKEANPAEDHYERWQQVSAEQMRARAAQDAAAQLDRHKREMLAAEDKEKSDTEDDDSDEGSPKVVKLQAKPARDTKDVSERPNPLMDRTETGTDEHADETQAETVPIGPAQERVEQHSPETEAAFAAIAAAPEMADISAKKMPETPGVPLEQLAKPEAFSERAQNGHPELRSPELAAASESDDGFNDIVRNSFGGDPPGAARFHEQAPGEPPVDSGAGGNKPPNFPPTAEGGAWGEGENDPDRGVYYANVGPNPNSNPGANPNILNNPWIPAGGLTAPATWASIGAMGARHEYQNLRNRAEHAGLATAIVLLGIGHFRNRHKIKKQGREISQQGKQIDALGDQLRQERSAHNASRSRLEQVNAAQNVAAERPSQPNRETPKIGRPETGYFAAPVPVAAKAESAPGAQRAIKQEQASQLDRQELNWYLENNREAGRAIEKNPELHDSFAAAIAPNGERLESGKPNEQPVFNQEGTHEQLKNQYLDAAGADHSTAGMDASMVPLPTTQPGYVSSSFQQPLPQLPNTAPQQSTKPSSAKPVAAGAAVLVILAILFIIFVH